MRRFLELLHRGACPTELTSRFPDLIGREAFDALVAAGILQRGDPADWYPCPGGGDACPRRVVDNPGDPERPFVAIPGGDGVCCQAVPLRAEQLEQHTTSTPDLVRALRSLLGIEGDHDLDEELFPCTIRIGREASSGREVLLSTWPSSPGFGAFLRSRKGHRRGALVLAPARTRWLPSSIEAQHGPGERIELAFLEDLIEVCDGRLERVAAGSGATLVREPQAAYGAEPAAFCLLIGDEGRRPISDGEYREVVAEIEAFDLFVDTMAKVERGRYRASKRLEDGTHEAGTLSFEQAHAIVELVERRRPMRAAELQALSSYGSPHKQVEAARRVVDVRLGRYQWRSIQLLREDDRQANRYVFNPPDGLRFAVLRPLIGQR